MQLGDMEVKTFYRIWLSLLEFTNRKHNIVPGLKIGRSPKWIDPQQLVPIKHKLWDDESIIEEYLTQREMNLSAMEKDIIRGWQRKVWGTFIIVKHLKNYTVFMQLENGGRLYGVTGITNPIEELFPSASLPLYAEATLVPFAGKIIYDSLIQPYPIRFEQGMKRDLNNSYRSLKNTGGIVTAL